MVLSMSLPTRCGAFRFPATQKQKLLPVECRILATTEGMSLVPWVEGGFLTSGLGICLPCLLRLSPGLAQHLLHLLLTSGPRLSQIQEEGTA